MQVTDAAEEGPVASAVSAVVASFLGPSITSLNVVLKVSDPTAWWSTRSEVSTAHTATSWEMVGSADAYPFHTYGDPRQDMCVSTEEMTSSVMEPVHAMEGGRVFGAQFLTLCVRARHRGQGAQLMGRN